MQDCSSAQAGILNSEVRSIKTMKTKRHFRTAYSLKTTTIKLHFCFFKIPIKLFAFMLEERTLKLYNEMQGTKLTRCKRMHSFFYLSIVV